MKFVQYVLKKLIPFFFVSCRSSGILYTFFSEFASVPEHDTFAVFSNYRSEIHKMIFFCFFGHCKKRHSPVY